MSTRWGYPTTPGSPGRCGGAHRLRFVDDVCAVSRLGTRLVGVHDCSVAVGIGDVIHPAVDTIRVNVTIRPGTGIIGVAAFVVELHVSVLVHCFVAEREGLLHLVTARGKVSVKAFLILFFLHLSTSPLFH